MLPLYILTDLLYIRERALRGTHLRYVSTRLELQLYSFYLAQPVSNGSVRPLIVAHVPSRCGHVGSTDDNGDKVVLPGLPNLSWSPAPCQGPLRSVRRVSDGAPVPSMSEPSCMYGLRLARERPPHRHGSLVDHC